MSRRLPVGNNSEFRAGVNICENGSHDLNWYKSSWSAHNGNCVEVANLPRGARGVRDSKSKDGSMLTFTASEWKIFLINVKAGNVDLT
jgi:hypothetical protein